MSQSIRIPITAAEKYELWQRWKKGEPLSEIGRTFKAKQPLFLLLSAPMVVIILINGNGAAAIYHSKKGRKYQEVLPVNFQSVQLQDDLNQIAQKLSTRPRKTLNFVTPVEKLNESVAMYH